MELFIYLLGFLHGVAFINQLLQELLSLVLISYDHIAVLILSEKLVRLKIQLHWLNLLLDVFDKILLLRMNHHLQRRSLLVVKVQWALGISLRCFRLKKAVVKGHFALEGKDDDWEVVEVSCSLELLLGEAVGLPAGVLVLLEHLLGLGAVIFLLVFLDEVLLNRFSDLFVVLLSAKNFESNCSGSAVIPLFNVNCGVIVDA